MYCLGSDQKGKTEEHDKERPVVALRPAENRTGHHKLSLDTDRSHPPSHNLKGDSLVSIIPSTFAAPEDSSPPGIVSSWFWGAEVFSGCKPFNDWSS